MQECKWVDAQQDRPKPYPKAGKIAVGLADPPDRTPHSQGMGYPKGPAHRTGHEYPNIVPVSQPIAQGLCQARTQKTTKARGGLPYHMLSEGQ